jgi:hypothetical protein
LRFFARAAATTGGPDVMACGFSMNTARGDCLQRAQRRRAGPISIETASSPFSADETS